MSTCSRLKLDPNFSHCTKSNSQCFEVDNVTPVAVTLLDKEAGKAFEDKDIAKDILQGLSCSENKVNSQQMEPHEIKKKKNN